MARALGTERGQAFLEVGRVVQADVLRQREADLGGALRQGVEAMEVVRDAPARPLGQAVGEVRVVVAVLTVGAEAGVRSEEHTSELQSLMRISYAVFCLKKKQKTKNINTR